MEIKYKLYPYPVLSSYSDDYKNGSFDATIDVVRDGYNYRLDFLATLTCQSLLERIKNGDAKYVYHLECAQTGFRTVIQTDQLSETYTLFSQTVNGKLQICPFVVAVKDLKGYSSSDFHDDYQGEVFDIEAGCVLAVGKMAVLDITKSTDDIANTPSIFALGKPPRFANVGCHQPQQNIGQIQCQQLCQLFRGHSPRSCSLCRTLPGSSAAACTSSCSFASTEGRLSLLSRDAEYSLNAEWKASASGALKKTRYRGGTSELSLRIA